MISEQWIAHSKNLLESLYKESYQPTAVNPKASGGVLLLGIPTVKDSVIQQAIAQVLSTIYTPRFSLYMVC